MPFTTYDELQTSVASWLNRTDLTTQIPDFISLNEAVMNRLLKTADMEQETTLATVGGVATVAVPTGFCGLRGMRIQVNGIWRDLQVLPLQPSLYNYTEASYPVAVTVVGSNFQFRPIPNGVYSITLNWYGKFSPLSSSNTSNWILASHPDAYLYGTLAQAEPWLKNDNRARDTWIPAFNSIIDQINDDDLDTRMRSAKLRVDSGLNYPRRFNVYNGYGA
jgi:hypothetical protein